MSELTANVSWLAVITGFVLSFLLGWLWYGPKLFGPKWAEGVGLDPKAAGKLSAPAMVSQAAGTFLLSWLVGVTAAHNALATLILAALTLMVLMAAGGLFANKSRYAIAAETGFVAAMTAIMVVVQAIF